MKKNFIIVLSAVFLLGGSAIVCPTSVNAISAKKSKEKGLIKENCQGYVVALKEEGKDIAEYINDKRKNSYEQIAKKAGASVDYVAKETGKKLCGK